MNSSGIITIPSLVIAGRTFTDLKNLIVLYGIANGSNQYCTPRKFAAAAGYTPSGAKAFRIWAVEPAANGDWGFDIGYADTDINVNAGPGTNSKDTRGNAVGNSAAVFGKASTPYQIAYDLLIPNGKYICTYFSFTGTGGYRVFGYEE